RALVYGGMVESEKRCADLEYIEPEDFARYLEYAYRRDYTVPPWEQDDSVIKSQTPKSLAEDTGPPPVPEEGYPHESMSDEVPMDAEPEPVAEDWVAYEEEVSNSPARKVQVTPVKIRSATLRPRFNSRNYIPNGDPKAAMIRQFAPEANSTVQQNFTPVFLAHARLYTFAGMRMVEPLKNLALHKLHKTLLDFKLYHQRVGDVVELARYAYEHGKDREDDGTMDELRTLVVEYLACEISTFGKHKEFVRLLEDGGEFVGDFWSIVMKDNLLC
ncbi:hypothetical protein BKA66DRAFT_418819, partial [Pyrenochaeta sp. MPI-SDFR-AT-0127]